MEEQGLQRGDKVRTPAGDIATVEFVDSWSGLFGVRFADGTGRVFAGDKLERLTLEGPAGAEPGTYRYTDQAGNTIEFEYHAGRVSNVREVES